MTKHLLHLPTRFCPEGHFYSPIVDTASLVARKNELWPKTPSTPAGIDFNDESHKNILVDVFPRYIPDYDYPERLAEGPALRAFYTRNSQFSWLDARALFVLLRHWAPSQVIEVGSGYSSLLMADVNHRWFGDSINFTCIEPYPPAFLKQSVCGISRLIDKPVQAVPLVEFEKLNSGDVLFIDSSHVAKTGSDVNFLYFDVLPLLKRGVHIHIHDIFLPNEYPQTWVINDNRSWNEQYLVRALLMYSTALRVDFGCSYAFLTFPHLVEQALALSSGRLFGGGSLWLTKIF